MIKYFLAYNRMLSQNFKFQLCENCQKIYNKFVNNSWNPNCLIQLFYNVISISLCIRDLEKLSLIRQFEFRFMPIFCHWSGSHQILLASNVIENDPEIIILPLLPSLSPISASFFRNKIIVWKFPFLLLLQYVVQMPILWKEQLFPIFLNKFTNIKMICRILYI